jgi:hypothetical protein
MKILNVVVAVSAAALASTAWAQSPQAEVTSSVSVAPSPKLYLAAFAGTTLVTRGSAGTLLGPSQDVTPMVGIGYVLTPSWSLELDVGPTFVAGTGYTGLALVPGVVFTVNSYLYLCGRVITILHPSVAFIAQPGVGLSYTFSGGWAPFAELDFVIASSALGGADVSAALAVGVAKYF